MIKNHTVSVIVPVYNEEKTVRQLMSALVSFPAVDEVIGVDDGSKDRSYKRLKRFKNKIELIHYAKNKGKGYALYRGVMAAKGEIIIFFDSDIVGLDESDIKKLVNKLLQARTKMVLGHPRGTRLLGVYIKSLVGERAFFKTDLLPIMENFKSAGFGVETYLNSVFKKRDNVRLGCRHLEKFEKYRSGEALTSYLKEGLEIVREKAKIEGVWSNEIEKQLKSIGQVKTWQELISRVKSLPNRTVRRIFEKYVLLYAKRIKAFLTE